MLAHWIMGSYLDINSLMRQACVCVCVCVCVGVQIWLCSSALRWCITEREKKKEVYRFYSSLRTHLHHFQSASRHARENVPVAGWGKHQIQHWKREHFVCRALYSALFVFKKRRERERERERERLFFGYRVSSSALKSSQWGSHCASDDV